MDYKIELWTNKNMLLLLKNTDDFHMEFFGASKVIVPNTHSLYEKYIKYLYTENYVYEKNMGNNRFKIECGYRRVVSLIVFLIYFRPNLFSDQLLYPPKIQYPNIGL